MRATSYIQKTYNYLMTEFTSVKHSTSTTVKIL